MHINRTVRRIYSKEMQIFKRALNSSKAFGVSNYTIETVADMSHGEAQIWHNLPPEITDDT